MASLTKRPAKTAKKKMNKGLKIGIFAVSGVILIILGIFLYKKFIKKSDTSIEDSGSGGKVEDTSTTGGEEEIEINSQPEVKTMVNNASTSPASKSAFVPSVVKPGVRLPGKSAE